MEVGGQGSDAALRPGGNRQGAPLHHAQIESSDGASEASPGPPSRAAFPDTQSSPSCS